MALRTDPYRTEVALRPKPPLDTLLSPAERERTHYPQPDADILAIARSNAEREIEPDDPRLALEAELKTSISRLSAGQQHLAAGQEEIKAMLRELLARDLSCPLDYGTRDAPPMQ